MSYDLKCGHAIDLIGELPDESVDVVFTSPPWWGEDYDIPAVKGWGRLGHEKTPSEYAVHVSEILAACWPKLKRSGMVWLAVRDVPAEGRLQAIPSMVGMSKLHRLYWCYTCYWVDDGVYLPKSFRPYGPVPATTPILGFAKDPDYHYWEESKVIPDWLAYSSPVPEEGRVFQALPSDLVSFLLESSCPSGGTVVDPMCGNGTVIARASLMGFHGIGFDIDKKELKRSRRKVIREKEFFEQLKKEMDLAAALPVLAERDDAAQN
jgi:DNA modification methylase